MSTQSIFRLFYYFPRYPTLSAERGKNLYGVKCELTSRHVNGIVAYHISNKGILLKVQLV